MTLPLLILALAGGIWFQVNSLNGALTWLGIEGDPMPWVQRTDGSQHPWVGEKYSWGLGYMDVDGTTFKWEYDGQKYHAGAVEISVERRLDGADMIESYTFRNTSSLRVRLKDIGIYTPFNDNYPDAATCMASRCHAHIWPGGKAAWVCAVPMNGKGPGLGLMVEKGSITDYEIWERGNDKGWSNDRGVFALCPPDMTLRPGRSYTLSWRVFSHGIEDFEEELLARGGTIASSSRYVYETGERCKVVFRKNGRSFTRSRKLRRPGQYSISRRGARADILAIPSPEKLLEARASFILSNQRMSDREDPRYGAFMVYDNETGAIVTDDMGRSDLDEGRERVGMGIFLAAWYRLHPSDNLLEALEDYARFIRTKLQQEDYTTTSSVFHAVPDRGYNYPWIADFYFRMYEITGEKQYALDGYGTLTALFRRFGYGFYCIDYPVTRSLKVLSDAGFEPQKAHLLECWRKTADIFTQNGLDFPSHEVNYEQSIVAPAVQFLSEMYLLERDERYLEAAREMMPALSAFAFRQPSYRLHGIPIRHWDGWWFGKDQTYGDVFPHYWSVISAWAYHYYSLATGEPFDYEEILKANLASFSPDGKATCAYLYPRRIDGKPGQYADAYANDQDWALVAYLDLIKL